MKVFISYGHNDHVKLVDAVFDALISAGHSPWKDDRYEGISGIKPGEDFVQVIYDAICDSDFVIAFVTAATQQKDFCCDERQYAYNHKGSHFIQIRLDGVDVRLGNSRSYIDMSDVEAGDGRLNERILEEKIKSLLAAFRDPASFAEGGFTPWTKFEAHLKVPGAMKYAEFITMPDREDFVGREWLCEMCRTWAMDSSIACRLFVILGEAGTGKTAFIRHLASDRSLVRSVHVCIYDRPSTRGAREMLKDLAYILAANNDLYFNFLKNKNFEEMDKMGIDGLFEFLFLEPLKNETEKYLLVIDGLDELDETNGLNPLIKLFRQFSERINPNVSFLVTGRPDENITEKLRTIGSGKPVEKIMLDRENGKRDLSLYITAKLNELGCYSPVLQEHLLDACDGNFEYLSLLFKEAKDEGLNLTENMKMPVGLYARYTQYLDRRMENNNYPPRFTRPMHLLLSVISVALEPLPLSVLAEFIGTDEFDAESQLAVFGSLIRKRPDSTGESCISFFAKGLRDYFLSKAWPNYSTDYYAGTRAIAQFMIRKCKTVKALSRYPYLDRNGFVHLLAYGTRQPEEVAEWVEAFWEADEEVTSLKLALALCAGDAVAMQTFCELFADHDLYREVVKRLKERRATEALSALASCLDENGNRVKYLHLQGDILRLDPTPEHNEEAEKLSRQMLEICREEYDRNPCRKTRYNLLLAYDRLFQNAFSRRTSKGMKEAEDLLQKIYDLTLRDYNEMPDYRNRRSLMVTYDQFRQIERNKIMPDGLEEDEWVRKTYLLAEQNYREKPCYESRRDLAFSYGQLADIAKAKNTPAAFAEAEQWHMKGLPFWEQNYQENPCYQSRRDLAMTYDQLASIAKAKNTPEAFAEAEQWYKKELPLWELNYRENPCYQSRRDLGIIYDRFADAVKAKNTQEAFAEAEQWSRKGLPLWEQNYRENPCYESRRDLGIIYNRLADMVKTKNTPEAFAEAEQWSRKGLPLWEQNHQENPCYQSRRDLGITYNRFADAVKAKNTSEAFAEAEQWYKKGLPLWEQNYRENPCYESREDLGIIYNRLANIAKAKNTPEAFAEAEQWYKKGLPLWEQNYREDPCYTSRQNLAYAYSKLAEVADKTGYFEQEEDYYRKCYALYKQNHQENPCFESRKDLALVCDRLGRFMPEDAFELFSQERVLLETNYLEQPYKESRRELAVCYSCLSVLEEEKDTPEGLAEAERWFQKAYDLFKQNHELEPTQDTQADIDLAVSILQRLKKKNGAG